MTTLDAEQSNLDQAQASTTHDESKDSHVTRH